MGGALAAIEAGYVGGEIQDAAYQYQRAVEHGEQVIVGVNKFTVEEDPHPDLLRVDPAIETAARERLADLRARRDNAQGRGTARAARYGGARQRKSAAAVCRVRRKRRDARRNLPHAARGLRRISPGSEDLAMAHRDRSIASRGSILSIGSIGEHPVDWQHGEHPVDWQRGQHPEHWQRRQPAVGRQRVERGVVLQRAEHRRRCSPF